MQQHVPNREVLFLGDMAESDIDMNVKYAYGPLILCFKDRKQQKGEKEKRWLLTVLVW